MDTKGHEWDWVQPRPPAYAEATAGKPAADHAAGATAEGVFEGLRIFDRGCCGWRGWGSVV